MVQGVVRNLDRCCRSVAEHKRKHDASLLKTMQTNFTDQDCVRTADLVESYIHFLLDKYGRTPLEPSGALIRNIKTYVAENLLSDFSMEDLAEVFNYNEKYLGRLFKEKTGQTIREYCNFVKLEQAKSLLKYGKMSIADVASKSGYNNVTYFNRIFKNTTGMTPQNYRSKNV